MRFIMKNPSSLSHSWLLLPSKSPFHFFSVACGIGCRACNAYTTVACFFNFRPPLLISYSAGWRFISYVTLLSQTRFFILSSQYRFLIFLIFIVYIFMAKYCSQLSMCSDFISSPVHIFLFSRVSNYFFGLHFLVPVTNSGPQFLIGL